MGSSALEVCSLCIIREGARRLTNEAQSVHIKAEGIKQFDNEE